MELGLIYIDSKGTFKRLELGDSDETLGDAAARALNVKRVVIEDPRSQFVLVTSEERYADKDLEENHAMDFLDMLPGACFGHIFQWDALVLGRNRKSGAKYAIEFAFTETEMDKMEKHFDMLKRNLEKNREYSKRVEEMKEGDPEPAEPDFEEGEMSNFSSCEEESEDDEEEEEVASEKRSRDEEEDKENDRPKKKARVEE